ncbi:MAG: gamma-glutamylcyclotransferase [Comamonadaceae bacterium]|nr:gamma-glutamylcyclotransferase [Burkholderiales bacterium]MEB2348018.1 gamma-glutamylcyclotransferase [Comamonadaceae bacterium]
MSDRTSPSSHRAARAPAADPLYERMLNEWRAQRGDLWVFGYGSLMWRPDLPYDERRSATVHGWHRALQMWSHVNRGTPARPGLVFALIAGGSCRGIAYRVPRAAVPAVFPALWQREMPMPVYDPRWLHCRTPQGPVRALGFTLSRASAAYTGVLADGEYRHIFEHVRGIYGSTREYAEATHQELQRLGIHDRALARIIAAAGTIAR